MPVAKGENRLFSGLSRRRVGAVVDLAQVGDGHLGVDAGGVEPRVAEHLLDQADVRAVLEHVRGA